jgi:hypothetical protein
MQHELTPHFKGKKIKTTNSFGNVLYNDIVWLMFFLCKWGVNGNICDILSRLK